ncbi:MAG: NUDIX hydrolase [Acidobacteria bacterium]|nr:NUDIX hydrolase [Acidobacteriota bacterium]
MKPEKLSTKNIYKGRIFDVLVERIRENGLEYDREIVRHAGSVVIVPVFADLTVALVRQYRHAAGEYLLEIPAGTIERGEDPETGARRELEEEIGVTATNLEKLTEFFVSPGFLTELMHVFLATGLVETEQRLEADEFISVARYSFDEIFEMIHDHRIRDAKTICGVLLAAARFGRTFSF